jgi:hypothetical protein
MPRSLAALRDRPTRVPLTTDQRNSLITAVLSWTMDAFDYFLVIVILHEIVQDTAFCGGAPKEPVRRRAGVRHDRNHGDTTGRCADLRAVGRPGRPAHPADRGHTVVVRVRRALRDRTEPHGAGDPAVPLRHLHEPEWGLGAALAMEKGPPSHAAAFSPACCNTATHLVICWPCLPAVPHHAAPALALDLRAVHHPGVDQPAGAVPVERQ